MTTDPITKFVAASPKAFGAMLLAFAALCVVPVALYGSKAFFETAAVKPADAKPDEPAPPPVLNPERPAQIAYTLAGIIGIVVAGSLAVGAFASDPFASDDLKATRARKLVLATGSLLGGAIMLFGLALGIVWLDSITKWLDAGEIKEAPRVLVPVIVVVFGAALMFLGSQPARAEERHNPGLRRLIYGTNLGLSTMLLVIALLAANILLSLKLPARLDTTESGFYSLSENTKNYLGNLDQPVTAYTVIAPTDRYAKDALRLLDAVHDASPQRFSVKTISLTDKTELTRLKSKFPKYDFYGTPEWILLTTGDDESRNAFVTMNDMLVEGEGRGQRVFAGEAKLMREVLFLSDNKTKPVVYFTQGHGELSLGASTVGPPGRTANALKSMLEKNYVDVRPWAADGVTPAIPDDATAVIVADPRTPFTPEEATALATYMHKEFADKRKGKLIVLSSPYPNPDGKGVTKTGLEGLLLDYLITLGEGYVLSMRVESIDFTQQLAAPSLNAIESGNPIAGLISNTGALLTNCRTVNVKPPQGPEASITPELLLGSYPPDRISWIDPDPPTDPAAQFTAFRQSPQLMQKFKVTRDTLPLAAVATEGKTPRVIVIGSGAAFADGSGRSRTGPPPVNLIAAGLDWLRDRPTPSIVNKTYQNYALPRAADSTRLFWLPVGLTLIAVLVAGLGVWTIRRQ